MSMMSLAVPFFSLQQQTQNLRDQLLSAITRVVDEQQFIQGPFVQACEADLARFTGSRHCIGLNSGTDALLLALKAVHLKENEIVLTTPFSFIASSSEIVHLKGHPVFIDIHQKSYNLDPERLQAWLEQETVSHDHKTIHKKTGYTVAGILTVDLFGQLADYKKINALAQAYHLWVIEDACQAIGATDQEKQAGTFGDIGTFSFYPTKNLGAFGDAGCCLTDNPVYAEHIIKQRNHGRFSHYVYEELGVNSRLDAVQAAVLSVKLEHLPSFNKRRKEIAHYYLQELSDLSGIKLPECLIGEHSYHQFTLWVQKRDELMQYLESKQIGTRIFYPQTLPDISFLRTDPRLDLPVPIADQAVQSVLSLPIYPELSDLQVEYVAQTIRNAPSLKTTTPPLTMSSPSASL